MFISFAAVGLDLVLESNDDYITAELDKSKRRMREMSQTIDQIHTLTRLIVQVITSMAKLKVISFFTNFKSYSVLFMIILCVCHALFSLIENSYT